MKMIIKRKLLKLFGIRDTRGNDPLPNPLFNPDKHLMDQYGLDLEIEDSKKYSQDQQKLDSVSKARLKKLRKSIISDLNYYEDGDISDADTHYLASLSKHPSKSHLVSKKINGSDRLNYRIYKPRLYEDSDGNIHYHQKIVFESCLGHDTNGQGTY